MNPYATAASALLAPTYGFKCGQGLASILSTTPGDMPEWMHWVLGPFGALIGGAFMLWWFMQRAKQADIKQDKIYEELKQMNERGIEAIQQCKASMIIMTKAQEAHTEELRARLPSLK